MTIDAIPIWRTVADVVVSIHFIADALIDAGVAVTNWNEICHLSFLTMECFCFYEQT